MSQYGIESKMLSDMYLSIPARMVSYTNPIAWEFTGDNDSQISTLYFAMAEINKLL